MSSDIFSQNEIGNFVFLAIHHGHSHILGYFTDVYRYVPALRELSNAAKTVHLPIVKELVAKYKVIVKFGILSRAIEYGYLPNIEYLFRHCNIEEHHLTVAVWSGHRHVMRWFIEQGVQFRTTSVIKEALNHNSIEWLDELVGQGFPVQPDLYHDAALKSGDMSVVLWALHKCSVSASVLAGVIHFSSAVQSNHFPLAKYLFYLNTPPLTCTSEHMKYAAELGNLEMCQWLYANGAPLDDLAFYSALRNSHLSVCDWMFQQLQSAGSVPLLSGFLHYSVIQSIPSTTAVVALKLMNVAQASEVDRLSVFASLVSNKLFDAATWCLENFPPPSAQHGRDILHRWQSQLECEKLLQYDDYGDTDVYTDISTLLVTTSMR
jgi:hypothetical protein